MNFKQRVRMYLGKEINEEMADKTSGDLSSMVSKLKSVYKNGTVLNIQKYANELKTKANALRSNNAYKTLVASADALVAEMMAYTKTV
jgi:hypothetical protein